MILTNKLDLPQPFVDAATSHHEYKPNRYSVTEVLGGTCEAVLKRRHAGEATEDVSDRLWAVLGSAVHKVLESAQSAPEQHQEQWLCVKVGDYELSGIFDLYDETTGTVTDWKVTSVYTVLFGDFEKWRKQTLAYCWMLRQKGHGAHRGQIVAMLRDHNMRKAKIERDYPPHPVFTIEWDFTEEDFKAIESDIFAWFGEVWHQEITDDNELEPCSPEQRWHKPDKWAVKKKGRKTAIRVYESEKDARVRAMEENKMADSNDLYYVEFREGEDTKCDSYCPVSDFCPFAQAKKSDV